MRGWLPPGLEHHVGAPSPADLFQGGPAQYNLGDKPGPISSSSVNTFLKSVASAEIAAEAATGEAEALANQAAAANDGYAEAIAKIRTAAGKWRAVRKLALEIQAASPQQSTPELSQDLAQAKLAVPGIQQTVHAALQHLVSLSVMLQADQAEKRPDLPPAKALDPEAEDSSPWTALAIAAGIGYLLWKVVF